MAHLQSVATVQPLYKKWLVKKCRGYVGWIIPKTVCFLAKK